MRQQRYIPTITEARLIKNYFICNNFQDFNTWQQIAHTKTQYTFIEAKTTKCKVVLKWHDKSKPTIVEEGESFNRRKAKKIALSKVINTLIFQGHIGCGFKTNNFVQLLPKRREQESSSDSSDENQWKIINDRTLSELSLQRINVKEAAQYWGYGLMKQDKSWCMEVIKLFEEEVEYSSDRKMESHREQVEFHHQSDLDYEELADFITILSSQKVQSIRQRYESQMKSSLKQNHLQCQLPLNHPMQCEILPTSIVQQKIKSMNKQKKIINIFQQFYPIQGKNIFQNKVFKTKEIKIPKFQQKQAIHYKLLNQLHNLVFFTLLRNKQFIHFALNLLHSLTKVSLKKNNTTKMLFYSQNVQKQQYDCQNQKGQQYFLKQRITATQQYLRLLQQKLHQSSVTLQGMIDVSNSSKYLFEPMQPQQIVKRKLGATQHQQIVWTFCRGDYVLVSSKISAVKYIGLIIDSPLKVCIPFMELKQRQPFTIKKLLNKKILHKITTSILSVSRKHLNIFEQHTTLFWQLPTYSTNQVIAQLIAEWIATKQSILLISPHAIQLKKQLINMGFIISSIQEKSNKVDKTNKLDKSEKQTNIFVKNNDSLFALPHAFCIYPKQVFCQSLNNKEYSRICIDQAHLVSQLISIHAICKGCQQLFLIGDMMMPNLSNQVSKSLYQRLLQENKPTQTYNLLNNIPTGDNMIVQWAQNNIYNNKLFCRPFFHSTPLIKGFPWPNPDRRVCILHYEASEIQQLRLCSSILCSVLKSGFLSSLKVGLSVVHHCSEAQYILKTQMQRLSLDCEDNFVIKLTGSRFEVKQMGVVWVGNNPLIIDYKAINAGLHSYSRGVVFVGNVVTLCMNPYWKHFLQWGISQQLVRCFQKKTNNNNINYGSSINN